MALKIDRGAKKRREKKKISSAEDINLPAKSLGERQKLFQRGPKLL